MVHTSWEGLILMGPFGAGKSYLGRSLNRNGIARFTELEPLIYDRFAVEDELDIEMATTFIRAHYFDTLADGLGLAAFESTGVVQRPLLLELLEKYAIALIRVQTRREVCLQRVAQRNLTSKRPIEMANVSQFFHYWTEDIAPTYTFALEVDGTDEAGALQSISRFVQAS